MSEERRLGCTGDHTSLDSLINCERCSNIILDVRGQAADGYLDKIVNLKREIKALESIMNLSEYVLSNVSIYTPVRDEAVWRARQEVLSQIKTLKDEVKP